MSKRKPTSELNDRNWDQEEEPEEAGTFSSAGQDVLKNRVIRKAKRTIHSGSENSGSVFAGFALKTADSSVPKPSLSTGVTLNFGSNLTFQPKTNGTKQSSSDTGSKDSSDNPEYLRRLKVLNENILSWIQKHVEENPYCILTPSFQDYEKHLGDLEKKYSVQHANSSQDKSKSGAPPAASTESKGAVGSVFGGASSQPVAGGFTFGQSSTSQSADSSDKSVSKAPTTTTGGFTFASGLTGTGGFGGSSLTQSTGGFGGSSLSQSTGGFGASNLTQSTGGFGASGAKPFTFGFAAKAAADSTATQSAPSSGVATGEEEEEYQPPKVEVREIKEEGAVYTKRCKLYYQKDGSWTDRGVGNLHIKPTDDERAQLIIRADTNLGNILLNILLSSAMPTKRQGKNNVFLVCVPNPPIDPKKPSADPTPMLIRVKTAEEADELLAKLEEMKA